jgi:hypothetical protein
MSKHGGKEHSSIEKTGKTAFKPAHCFLMIPNLIEYFLTGIRHSEYTAAAASQLYNMKEKAWSKPLLEKPGFPRDCFAGMEPAGKKTGTLSALIGSRGPYPGACSGKFTTTENVVNQFSDRGMATTSTINSLSNEDTGKQACFELAPGFFIQKSGLIPRRNSGSRSATAQIKQRFQQVGIKPKNPLTGSRGRVL